MTAVAPVRSPLHEEYRRLDFLRLQRQGIDSKIAACEARIAELEAAALGVPEEDDADLTPVDEVPERVRQLKGLLQ